MRVSRPFTILEQYEYESTPGRRWFGLTDPIKSWRVSVMSGTTLVDWLATLEGASGSEEHETMMANGSRSVLLNRIWKDKYKPKDTT